MSTASGSPGPAVPWIQWLRVIRYLPQLVRLYWRLVLDRRVSIWPKAMLIASLVYVLSPIDLIPDLSPVIGQVDDLVLLLASCRLFIRLCPREVVLGHVRQIGLEGVVPRPDRESGQSS